MEPPEQKSQSDLAALWERALDDYSVVSKVNIRTAMSSQLSVYSIMMDQHLQLESFKSFRHNNSKVDRLRSVISANAEYIQAVAKHVADAASAAFPPSSAILTAFTFVISASKHVSEDYDTVESFFNIMQSFLRRLSLLENKIPPQRVFQEYIIEVFSSILNLSAIARSYCLKGRFLKWAKALVDEKDPNLQNAYNSLHENLKRLESATILQILRTTIEISERGKDHSQNINAILVQNRLLQAGLAENTAVTQQTYSITSQTQTMTMEIRSGINEVVLRSRDNADSSKEILKKLEKLNTRDNDEKKRSFKAGASKPANLEALRRALGGISAEPGMLERERDLGLSTVERVFNWVEEERSFVDLVDNEGDLLWVSGASGMGKSTLAFKIGRLLKDRFACEPSTQVVSFFFDEEHSEMRSIQNMLRWCSIKIAEGDHRYCEEVLMDLRRNGDIDSDEAAWTRLVESRFPKGSDRRLILILDGIDENEKDDRAILIGFINKARSQKCSIWFIVTSEPDNAAELSPLEPKRIDLVKEKVAHDMRRVISFRVKNLPKLRNLRSTLRRSIVKKVSGMADSFLYIEHTVRRLNSLGRVSPILKELENLPPNTTALYETLLNDCRKNRSPEERELLRSLLAWLAYAKSKLTISEANRLIDVIKKENSISIEEELDGRLSRLLRISTSREENEKGGNSSDNDGVELDSDTTEKVEESAEDAGNLLSFQERSLRAYFRQAIDDPQGLRCTPNQAQVIIFKMIAAILTLPKLNQTNSELNLAKYAANWGFYHLLEIKVDEVDNELATAVLESLYSILSNKNDALRDLEELANGDSTIFTLNGTDKARLLQALLAWAKRAVRLPMNSLPYGVLDWFRPLSQEPSRVFITLARAHIHNWFSALHVSSAYNAFGCAHYALKEAKNMPELRQNKELTLYFEEVGDDSQLTERSVEVVANAFWDIVKTPKSFWGIGMAMKRLDLYEGAIGKFDIGLNDATIDDMERYRLLVSKGQAQLHLGRHASDEGPKQRFLTDAVKTLGTCMEIYHGADDANKKDIEVIYSAFYSLVHHASAAALLGKDDLILGSLKEAFDLRQGPVDSDSLSEIIAALASRNQHGLVMDIFKIMPSSHITYYFLVMDNSLQVQEAAKRSGQGDFLVELYATVTKSLAQDTWLYASEHSMRMQLQRAGFARQALADADGAKQLLRGVVRDPACEPHLAVDAANSLAELLLEDFRAARAPPLAKKAALDEAKSLVARLGEVLGADFAPAESHLATTLALMLRRLGPALELADVLGQAFRSCVDGLRDDVGYNDSTSCRRLARVLRCVEGMEWEAEVALTAQLYILDEGIYRKEALGQSVSEAAEMQAGVNKEARVDADETDKPDELGPLPNGEANGINGEGRESVASIVTQIKDGTSEEANHEDVQDEMAVGLVKGDVGFYCNVCRKDVSDWAHGGAYFCLYCIDCDICEDCFAKREAREKGELEPDWRVVCPQGHKHVKAPVEGWRGVKDGKLRIGETEIPFQEWLNGVESKWAAYWDRYWSETDVS